MRKIAKGGGWAAVRYALRMARQSGGVIKFYRAMKRRNACKTCALGMGGQRGGMTDESGRFPEVCKKSIQAMAADMQDGIPRDFFSRNGFDELRRLTPRELEHSGRLVEPLYADANDTRFRPISWDDALAICIRRLNKTTPDQNFFYVSGRSSNEAAFLLQLFARLYGTNNVNNCSYYCHQASGVGLTSALGSGTATVVLDDLSRCDLVFLIGGNPASNHPRLMRRLMEVRRRGGKVIVINPLVEIGLVNFSVPSDARSLLLGSPIASRYVQPCIGGDIALLSGIAKRLVETNAVNETFIERHTEGWEDARQRFQETSWREIENASGVDRETIHDLAATYAQSRSTIFAWTMGITHHEHGVDNVRAIANLALMRGMVGRPSAGLLPIRGHSNVQGIGSVGVTPTLKKIMFERLESHFSVQLPKTQGLDTLACIAASLDGRMTNGWCLGGNLYGASPDARSAERAISRLDSIVYLSTALNTGHAYGRAKETMILPMLVRDEEAQATTQESMFSFVRLSDGGPRRHDGPRSEVETIATIARGVLGDDGPIDWRSMQRHRTIRKAIGAIVPGYEKILAMDETKKEFQIEGRTFHDPQFPTSSGRAKFHAIAIPNTKLDTNQLRLMTIRSEGQFNTVVYEEHDLYRNQDRRDVILMNPEDIERLGLCTDQRVTVQSETGRMDGILVREFAIRSGNAAMYYPEANLLVPMTADPESRTPAFKAVPVTVSPAQLNSTGHAAAATTTH